MSESPGETTCPLREALSTSRRAFLIGTGATLIWIALPGCRGRVGLERISYPRKAIGKLSELRVGAPVVFHYPFDHPSAMNFLVRLTEPAGGGVGPERDVVAFNSVCTHQGGPLAGRFRADGVAGPCPLHWTTFDLTRHGMVVSGHATQGLPQIVLETEGDDIVATGVQGLIFGYESNGRAPTGERSA